MNVTPIKVTQGNEILRLKAVQHYPVPCNEWNYLQQQIESLTTEPWFFQNAGFLLLGAAVPTVISIWTGAVLPSAAIPNAIVIAWAVAAVCSLTGAAAIYFAHKERSVHRAKASMLLEQMKIIEQRVERGA